MNFRSLAFVYFLIYCFVGPWSQAQSSSTFSVALLDFNVISGSGEVADPAIGQIMSVFLERELVNSRRFVVVERTSLSNVLDELALSEQGFVGSEDVKKFGEFKGVDIVVFGDILVFDDFFDITAKFVEVGSSQISQAPSLTAESTQGFADVARAFVAEAKVRFPLQGLIVQIEGEQAFVRLGTDNGLTQQDTQGIVLRERSIAGSVILDEVGRFTIERIFPELSQIAVDMNEGFELQEGDVIRVTTLDAQGIVPNVVTEGDPANEVVPVEPEVVTLGALTVSTTPISAEVFLDGEGVGSTPLALEGLEAGEYQLELRAENYQNVSELITVTADAVLEVNKELVPFSALVFLEISESGFEVLVNGISRGQLSQLSLPPGEYDLEVRALGKVPKRFSVAVSANERLTQAVVLDDLEASLSFLLEPANAVVELDGQIVSASELSLPAGSYLLEVSAEGFKSFEEELLVESGVDFEKVITLEALAVLSLEVNQAEYEVLLDGELLGHVNLVSVESGTYLIEVRSPELDSFSRSVSLGAGEFLTERFEFEALSELTFNLPIGAEIIAISLSSNQSQVLLVTEELAQTFRLKEDEYRLVITLPDQTVITETIVLGSSGAVVALPAELEETQSAGDEVQSQTEVGTQEAAEDDNEEASLATEQDDTNQVSSTKSAEVQQEPSGADTTLALSDDEAGLIIATNKEGTRVFFESASFQQEVLLETLELELALPADFYTYRATAPGSNVVEDAVFLSGGVIESLSLEFEGTGVTLLGGTFNSGDLLDLFLFSSIETDEEVYRLSLAGEGFNGGLALVTQLGRGLSSLWLGDVTAVTGRYEADLFGQKGTLVATEFSVDTENSLNQVTNLSVSFNATEALVSWQAEDSSEWFEVEFFRGGASVFKADTNNDNYSYTLPRNSAGSSYTICLTNYNFALDSMPETQPNAARVCRQAQVPSEQSNGGSQTSGAPETPETPVDPGPPEPPPPPDF